jgi:hypothetical protein
MNSAVMAQLHCGYRDRRRVRPLFSHMAVRRRRDPIANLVLAGSATIA